MTQPPHYPYQPYAQPPADPLDPARRAATLMFVLAGLMIILGGCFSVVGGMMPWDEMPPEQREMLQRVETEMGIDARTFFVIVGLAVLLPGVLLIVLGLLVRRGGMASAIISIILVGLIELYLLFNLLTLFRDPAALAGPAAVGACITVVLLALFGLLLTWLIQAARAAPHVKALRDQQAAQYWQYQQQYGQGGYSYPYPPGPPPPPSPPPDQSAGGPHDPQRPV